MNALPPHEPQGLPSHIARRLMRALTFWGSVGIAFYVAETALHWS